MHEFSIIQSLIPQLEECIDQGHYKKVIKIHLEVGVMSGVIADALEFAYDICSKGTSVEGAELSIRMVPLTASCEKCSIEFELQDYCFACPQCNGTALKMLTGHELRVKEIEVEES